MLRGYQRAIRAKNLQDDTRIMIMTDFNKLPPYEAIQEEKPNESYFKNKFLDNIKLHKNNNVISENDQDSEEFLKDRLGVITGSDFHNLVSYTPGGKFKANEKTYKTYMNIKIAEVITGESKEFFKSASMEHGNIYESEARKLYANRNFCKIKQTGIIYLNENKRIGWSPDGLIEGTNGAIEIKCQDSANHVRNVRDNYMEEKFYAQNQFGIYVRGLDYIDHLSYDPRIKTAGKCIKKVNNLYKIRVYPDYEFLKKIDEVTKQFIEELDHNLALFGATFGEQWS